MATGRTAGLGTFLPSTHLTFYLEKHPQRVSLHLGVSLHTLNSNVLYLVYLLVNFLPVPPVQM